MRGSVFCMAPLVLLEALPLHVIVYLSCICTCTMFYTTRDCLWIFLVCTCTCVHLLVGSPQSIHSLAVHACIHVHLHTFKRDYSWSLSWFILSMGLVSSLSACIKRFFLLMCSYSSYGRMYMYCRYGSLWELCYVMLNDIHLQLIAVRAINSFPFTVILSRVAHLGTGYCIWETHLTSELSSVVSHHYTCK